MTRFTDLDHVLEAYFDGEVIAPAPDGLLETVLGATAKRRPQPAWRAAFGSAWADVHSHRMRLAGVPRAHGWWLLAAVALLLAATVAGAVGIGSLITPPPARVFPSESAPLPVPLGQLPGNLVGTWVAVQPATMGFGMPSGPARMTLIVGASTDFLSDGRKIGWMSADTTATPDVVRFVSRIDPSDPSFGRNLPADGVSMGEPGLIPACRAGEVGVYAWSVDPDRAGTLVLTPASDECAARRAIVENRIWQRVEARTIAGSLTVDAFQPAFDLNLPPGDYEITRTNASFEVRSLDRTIEVFAWQDPRVFRDGCDERGGRIESGPGVQSFIAGLRTRPEFTIQSQRPRQVGGSTAEVIRLSSRANEGCPVDRIAAWQAAVETSGRAWMIFPGWVGQLVLVEVGGHTVMFEVNPSSPPEAITDEILDSIEFKP